MKVKDLFSRWEKESLEGLTQQKSYSLKVPLRVAAQIEALEQMYPHLTTETILSELISAALEEFRENIPYVESNHKIGEDEFGDPIFEDAGLTPKFIELTRKNRAVLKEQIDGE